MATEESFIQFVAEQAEMTESGWTVRYKKMFGEYMVYVNDKPVLLVCDNTVYVKQADRLSEIMKEAERGYPYAGAKEHYILDMENRDLSRKVIEILLEITPLPRKRVKKS